ncbi:BZ3500_MvSof-1268-A1-R1_Chr2-3g05381 [Microbotryum saponariae]|uniref:BZ3500_MvSof-1268-A1-R1_Chr2-3g05381 protein n=1 Tax=Microbotryum saponariae TaxID=289078 RepID=A0A2X0LQ98_9BASI|nr:BZ3500_MvSof-1268-A1-R1_Chr2-3g05381 [Microbotryum saponariae]SDA01323.1 BZ3501_MvSof-1269-A2-R1_Chr2-2g05054 [Microbotryum saponariae]
MRYGDDGSVLGEAARSSLNLVANSILWPSIAAVLKDDFATWKGTWFRLALAPGVESLREWWWWCGRISPSLTKSVLISLTASSVYQSTEASRTNLFQSDIDELQRTYQNKRVTLASIGANTSIIKLPAGHFGQTVISRNGTHPLVVTLFGKVAMLDPSLGKSPV